MRDEKIKWFYNPVTRVPHAFRPGSNISVCKRMMLGGNEKSYDGGPLSCRTCLRKMTENVYATKHRKGLLKKPIFTL